MDLMEVRRRMMLVTKSVEPEPYPVGEKFAIGVYEDKSYDTTGTNYRAALIPVRGGMILRRTGGQRFYSNIFYNKDMVEIGRYSAAQSTYADIDIPIIDGAYYYFVEVNYPGKLWSVYLERIA